eukprot:11851903-Alexandrium_andersonii.AAC.1
MSASLVGSEMCIRDRSSGTSADAGESAGGTSPSPCHGGRSKGTRSGGACLLYTSDAADDM